MAYEWAKPGVKCMCVDDELYDPPANIEYVRGLDGISRGAVYTIREVFIDPFEDNVQVRLAEIWRPQAPEENTGIEAGYRIERFRPLITKTQEQDVEMFLRLASPSPFERLDLLAERMNELAED